MSFAASVIAAKRSTIPKSEFRHLGDGVPSVELSRDREGRRVLAAARRANWDEVRLGGDRA
jgi:hypothetical protein